MSELSQTERAKIIAVENERKLLRHKKLPNIVVVGKFHREDKKENMKPDKKVTPFCNWGKVRCRHPFSPHKRTHTSEH